jgi:hypothetical protein
MLAQPLAVPGSAAPDGSVPSELRVAFQRFFAIKLFGGIHLAWSWHTPHGLAVQLLGAVGSLAMCFRRTAQLGIFIWFNLIGLQLVRTWPYTLNHFILEELVLLVLLAFPVRFAVERGREPVQELQLLWVTLLSVWFFAGVQKIGHGHYLTGESMALPLLAGEDCLGRGLRMGLSLVHSLLGPASLVSGVDPGAAPLDLVARIYCVGLSWLVIVGEVGLPLLALVPRTRRVATVGLCVAQCSVGLLSGEVDFAILGLGLIGLGSARQIPARYALLSCAAVLYALFPAALS